MTYIAGEMSGWFVTSKISVDKDFYVNSKMLEETHFGERECT